MKHNVQVKENKLIIDDTKVVFSQNIAELQKIDDTFIVRLEIPTNKSLTNNDFKNVYAVTSEGFIKWQIKNEKPENYPNFHLSPLVKIYVDSQNNLFVTDFMGRRYLVDLNLGNLTIEDITK